MGYTEQKILLPATTRSARSVFRKHRHISVLITFTFVAALLAGCDRDGTRPGSASETGSFGLYFSTKYDQLGDDVGGAKIQVDVPVVWHGSHQEADDTFTIPNTWTGFATDPWNTSEIVPNLTSGPWDLSVTVNGRELICPSVELTPGPLNAVTFQVDEADVFIGCH